MSLRSAFQPPLAAFITSGRTRAMRRGFAELGRRLRRRPHLARVYLRLEDPYSFVLAQVLDDVAARFDVAIELVPVRSLQSEMYPDRARLAAWARVDATHVARLYELEAPAKRAEPDEGEDGDDFASLSFAEASADGPKAAVDIMRAWWAGESIAPARNPSDARDRLARGESRLRADGHYLAATLSYGGEWYWGIDRLNHLERRWSAAGLAREPDAAPRFTRRLRLLEEPAARSASATPLVFYWSARSPYSYLAIERAVRLSSELGVALDIRPVLPMVMRNLAVPRTKRFYILLDAKREADLIGVPLGRVCDPVGAGVERCYAVLEYAREQDRVSEWVHAFATAVWSEGVDAATDRGISRIAERAGLDARAALARTGDESWRAAAERHRVEMLTAGFWGVPTLVFGDTAVWGQDRFWVLEAAMRREAA